MPSTLAANELRTILPFHKFYRIVMASSENGYRFTHVHSPRSSVLKVQRVLFRRMLSALNFFDSISTKLRRSRK